jgi:hypothetical protein
MLATSVDRTHVPNLHIIMRRADWPQPAYNNICWPQVESDEVRRHLYFHWSVNISGKPYLQRPLFQTNI